MGCCFIRNPHEPFLSLNKLTTNITIKGSTISNNTLQTLNEHEKVKKNSIVTEDIHNYSRKIDIPVTGEIEGPRVEIPNDVIKNGKKLYMKIIESEHLKVGSYLSINPGGLENSERMAKDGIVYFGKRNMENMNDFNFPEEEIVSDNHFKIKYDLSKNCYKIKNIQGPGTFIKVLKSIILKTNSIFSFGNTHIFVSIPIDVVKTESKDFDSKIVLKVIDKVKNDFKYEFYSKTKSTIKIGRIDNGKIDIVFPDDSISRLQCTIYYEFPNWYIVDCDGTRSSTNGTWILADDYYDVYTSMIVRAGLTSFEMKIE